MKKFLIVKIGAIGDVIMALPMIEAIRLHYGDDTEITWVVGKAASSILACFPVNHMLVVDENRLLSGNAFIRLCTLLGLWYRLFFHHFNRVIVGYYNWQYRVIALFSRVESIRSFGSNGARLCPIPSRHHVDEYIRLAVGDEVDAYELMIRELNFNNPVKNKILSQSIMQQKIIALAPGGAKNILSNDAQRRWPIESYVLLAKLLNEAGYRVVITGASSDAWVGEFFPIDCVENYVGKTTLLELAKLYDEVDLVITHDSGPMHIAGLVRANLIALFGPTNPHEKIPRYLNAEFIWKPDKYSCCPCYDGHTYANCRVNRCLAEITPEEVFMHSLKYL
jgi:heptosyltransferase II